MIGKLCRERRLTQGSKAALLLMLFTVKPEWSGRWPAPGESSEYRHFQHGLLHFGIHRPDYPRHINQSSLAILHDDAYGCLRLSVTSKNHVAWQTFAPVRADESWQPGRSRHVAAVWEAGAQRKNWLRLFVDGKRVSGDVSTQAEERLGADKSVRVEVDSSFFIQLGSLNSGRSPARAGIRQLRISRIARYRDDFSPPSEELKVDPDTTALFHFNASAMGEGMTPEGKRYGIEALPGTAGRE